jgi:hypothetical protein
MTNFKLLKLWRTVEEILKRAESTIPLPKFENKKEYEHLRCQFNEYLKHNELELAMDMLEELSTIVKCDESFWKEMQRAAELMELNDRAKLFKNKCDKNIDIEYSDKDDI